MKKVVSISFALLILLSGLNLTIATHFCSGELAQVRFSLSGEKATCGMENESDHKSLPVGFSNHCCDNESSVFAIDQSYSPVYFQFKNLVEHLSFAPVVLLSETFSFSNLVKPVFTNVIPPGNYIVKAPSLSYICVFRI